MNEIVGQNVRRVGRYEVLDEIGHGGMATVHKAHDPVLERHVALKVLHPHLRGTPEARTRFAREAKAVARLRHPNVLEVYDFGDAEADESFLAAELLTGPTLKEWVLAHPRLCAELGVALAIEIGEALAAAHAAGIVHRDVKPENVLLHQNASLKLTDFGIAHLVDAHSFTATGQVIGSPGHMAPEIVQGGEACVATDVFSFGTVLYFLLTGALPFTGRNPHQLLFRVLELEYPDPLRIEPAIGAELREIVVRTMAKEPAERPTSMRLLVDELRAYLAARGFPDSSVLAREALADPVAASARLRPLAVRAELALGEADEKAGDTMGALAHYDRALALEPGRADVLDRVGRVGRASSEHRRVVAVGLALGLLGLTVLAAGFFVSREAAPSEAARRGGASPAASRLTARGPGSEGAELRPAPTTETTEAADPTELAPSASTSGQAETRVDAGPSAQGREPSRAHAEPRVSVGAPRMVVFRPEPQNVAIAIDDGPARPFGPSFRGAPLAPGSHRIRIIPGTACCETLAFSLEVQPGTTPLLVARSLAFRPSRVYVVSPVPADVSVEIAGSVVGRGRTRALVPVPMRDLESPARIVVTAEGYRGYTGEVRLRAGEIAQASATLEPIAP